MGGLRDRGRPVRIAGASGSVSDRRQAMSSLAANHPTDPIDIITGDWLSEANMATRAAQRAAAPAMADGRAYEPTLLEALAPALPDIARYGIKVAVNAGASDTRALFEAVKALVRTKGLADQLRVAWIDGDNVLGVVQESLRKSKFMHIKDAQTSTGLDLLDAWMEGDEVGDLVKIQLEKCRMENICTGESLRDWEFKNDILGAQAYLGGLGIARAFEEGADIVIAGRVSDASPLIGGAYWWHGWNRDDLDQLANALVAGHLTECSTYVSGGNYSGFKSLEGPKWLNMGYPIAEIDKSGNVVITKQKGTGGVVNVNTCKAQLLYEIQGPWYFNSDVTAIIDDIFFEQVGVDRVALRGVKSGPPPLTTKVGITAAGGYQAEVHWFLVGLDIEAKARMLETQVREALGDKSRFHVLQFTLHGTSPDNPTDQAAATVNFRIFAQAKEIESISTARFLRPIIDLIMSGYPGATFHLDVRQGIPKPVQEYFVTLIPQSDIHHAVHLDDGWAVEIPPPSVTKTYPKQQPSQDTSVLSGAQEYGETIRGPLGWLVHARSGDKGSNANVGFWVEHESEYGWLRSTLSTQGMQALLANEYNGKKIDRFELPNLLAVHFLLQDHLDRGVSCSSTYDFLGKNVAEFLRSRHVDLPKKFLNRGKL